jgi:hypothetical protein
MNENIKIYTYGKNKVKYDLEKERAKRKQLTAEKKAEKMLQQKEAHDRMIEQHKGKKLDLFLNMQKSFYLNDIAS